MITKIEVEGFKSLSKFNLKLNKGLNILVGPNGAGKTNIIVFFEFLSKLASNNIGNAISIVGGAGSIFQKIGADKFRETIKSKIIGCYKINSKSFCVYEYSFEIKISLEKDMVYYSYQEIKMKRTTSFLSSTNSNRYPKEWDLHISYNTLDTEIGKIEKEKVVIERFNKNILSDEFDQIKTPTKTLENNLKRTIENNHPISFSLIRCFSSVIDLAFPILNDLNGGETFNIIPSKIRELEDSATPPGIRKDGSGLGPTLYAMKKNNRQNRITFLSRLRYFNDRPKFTYNQASFERIISFLKMANSSISNLEVENDTFNNKLSIKVSITNGDYFAVLPLSAMSDGTIKWLTLVTAILTSKTIISIEEPENYLHPWMQAEIVKIMRDHLNERKNYSFVLMTTHSESLLNFTKGEEIILVGMSEGYTKAARIKNLKVIKEEISHNAFGLGYFYFSNSLSNE